MPVESSYFGVLYFGVSRRICRLRILAKCRRMKATYNIVLMLCYTRAFYRVCFYSYLWIQSKAALKSRSEVNQSTTPGSVTHFSLRLTLYSWFTSPIRRYTDIQGQRLILEKIATSTSVRDPNVIEISQPKAPDLIE